MPARILITYASLQGSTPEIAQAIGKELQSAGHRVEVAHVNAVSSLEGYNAVVIGISLYTIGLHKARWGTVSWDLPALSEILNFIKKRFSEQLARMPVAVFAVGLTYKDMKPEQIQYVMTNLKNALSPLKPVSSALFAGTLDSKKLSFWMRFADISQIPSGDFQDWDKIKAWARKLPVLFKI
jgi:menaquinone-dependent protoporphyrinogen IX oxidase